VLLNRFLSGLADSYIYTFCSGFLVGDHTIIVCYLAQEPDYLLIVADKVNDMASPGHSETFSDVSGRPSGIVAVIYRVIFRFHEK
jgi:hypothetical protein